jgi:hypothetical protein
MGFLVFTLLTIVVDFAASQSLVLVGGNLNDGNAAIWGKVVELAVYKISFKLPFKVFNERYKIL